MDSKFTEVTLSEISIDGKGSYGIAAPAVEKNSELYTYLRITDITDEGYLIREGLKSVDDPKASNYVLKNNDIVFARTGNSTGRSYFHKTSEELVYAGFLIKFSLDPEKVNPKFIRYYTLSAEYKGWTKSFSTGSTRGNINAKTFGDMKIKLPSREMQDSAVNILDSMEEKIELNKEIIVNLEKLKELTFKQWFINFDYPNEQGLPYRSSGGEMVESELGEIPLGWNIVKLKEVTKLYKSTFNPKKSVIDEVMHFSLPAFDLKKYPTLDKVADIKSNKWIVEDNCVLFSKMNPITPRIWIPKIHEQFLNVASSEFVVLKNDTLAESAFIYSLCSSEEFNEYLKSNATGSTNSRQRITPDKALDYKFPMNYEVMNNLSKMLLPIIDKLRCLYEENNNLEKLRETLLPKLLSGEIEIPDESVVVPHE